MRDGSDLEQPLISGEQLVYTTRKHWGSLILDSGWAILMVVASFAVASIQPETTTGLLGFINRILDLLRLGLFLGGCGWFAYNLVAWRTGRLAVTNLRVLGNEGLVRRRSIDTLLSSVSDIRLLVPALGQAMGFGNVRIVSAGGAAAEQQFRGVRDPQGFKRQVLEQKVATSRRSGGSASAAASTRAAAPGDVSIAVTQLLRNLANLRDAGVIDADEYEAQRARWLSLL